MNREKVLVTGASLGIGAAVAKRLAEAGYAVTATSRQPGRIEKPLDGVRYLRLDLNDPSSMEACVNRAGDMDILINNAGRSHLAAAEAYPPDRTKALFQTNVFGPMRLIQGFLPGMRARRHGFILNVGSLAGKFPVPFQSAYVAGKSALAGYTWALRNEVMPFGIRVVVLEPSDIQTDIRPDTVMGGDAVYGDPLRKVRATRAADMKRAPGPEIVARKVERILKKKNPAPFYTVGGMAPLMVFVKRLLPDRTVEHLVRRKYGLS